MKKFDESKLKLVLQKKGAGNKEPEKMRVVGVAPT